MEDKEKEEEEEAAAVAAFVRKEVGDWDDEAKSRARFKALSGQRCDWEPLYCFWRDLILKTARLLRIFVIRPSRVTRLWFRRAGLSPLCLDRVLVEMHRTGDLLHLPMPPQPPTTTSRLSHILSRALDFFGGSSSSDYDNLALTGDSYILAPLLEEQALEVVNRLSEDYWTTSCVVTLRKFQDICLGSKEEALAILDYLSARGRARRLIINRADPIEGVKVCLGPGAASTASSMDYSLLHLTWTSEKLEQQLDLIDQRYQKSRNLALASLNCGNKRVALRYTKELKLASQSRERCTGLLDRMEKVLQVITDADSSKKVSDAIQSSTRAVHENHISIEEVELCLQELDENIDSLKRLDNALEATTAYPEIHDEDIEEEFNTLQLEIKGEKGQVPTKIGINSSAGVAEVLEKTDALSDALSNLHLEDGRTMNSVAECCIEPVGNQSTSKEGILEAA